MTMKKLFTILALGAGIICANAQSVKGNKFADNWTLGISGGVITPTTNHAFFGSMRQLCCIQLGRTGSRQHCFFHGRVFFCCGKHRR